MGHRILEISTVTQSKEDARRTAEEESVDVEVGEEQLTVVTAGTEEETAERLEASLDMEVNEEGEGQGEEGGDGNIRSLGAIEFLTQEAEPIGTTLVNACNGFNELSRLEMMWTVWHRWTEGSTFAFN